jgi:hypothetical protein
MASVIASQSSAALTFDLVARCSVSLVVPILPRLHQH